EDIWDAIVGAMTAAWEAVVAALNWLLDWIIDGIIGVFEAVLRWIEDSVKSLGDGIIGILSKRIHSEIPEGEWLVSSLEVISFIFTHPLFYTIIGGFLSLLVFEAVVTYLSGGTWVAFKEVIGLVIIDAMTALLLGGLGVLTGYAFGGSETIQTILAPLGFGAGIIGFGIAFMIGLKEGLGILLALKHVFRDFLGVVLALIGVFLVGLVKVKEEGYLDLYLDIVGVGLGIRGAYESYEGWESRMLLSAKIADALSFVCLGADITLIMSKKYDLD
ncbi:MAG: hypothetical protein ACE5KV_09655, partial [Thermoplasmata archaeon]